jgi:hypothetical protein
MDIIPERDNREAVHRQDDRLSLNTGTVIVV